VIAHAGQQQGRHGLLHGDVIARIHAATCCGRRVSQEARAASRRAISKSSGALA
jgi:hypothetical protein